jgi:hypothetical protein
MNEWLLQIIRCPITGQPLQLADAELVSQLRSQRSSGQLFSHKGIPIEDDFDSGLLSHLGQHSLSAPRRSRTDRLASFSGAAFWGFRRMPFSACVRLPTHNHQADRSGAKADGLEGRPTA